MPLRYQLIPLYTPANTSIIAEARRPSIQIAKRVRSTLNQDISALALSHSATLYGSATQRRINRNSSGACSHDVVSKRLILVKPPIFKTNATLAPRLKNPSKPAVNIEKVVSNKPRMSLEIGGFHLATTNGNRKDNVTVMQLLKNTRNMTAKPPRALTYRTGATIRVEINETMSCRNVGENSVASPPTSDPIVKTANVTANALSKYFSTTSPSSISEEAQ